MAVPQNLRWISLGSAKRNPPEGRYVVSTTIDMTASNTYVLELGGGTTQYSYPYMRSLWMNNNENPSGGATITATIVLTGQVITCLPGRSVYLPLFGCQPLQIVFSAPNNLVNLFNVIVGNFDFAASIVPLSRAASLVPSFSDAETPGGVINGVNADFTLANIPLPSASLELYNNGVLQYEGTAYLLAGNAITFQAGFIPQNGDVLLAYYRY